MQKMIHAFWGRQHNFIVRCFCAVSNIMRQVFSVKAVIGVICMGSMVDMSTTRANGAQPIAWGPRVGVVSAFPGKSGLFFRDRAHWAHMLSVSSVFPAATCVFTHDVNEELAQNLARGLAAHYRGAYVFVPLAGLDPETSLEGYFIEGDKGALAEKIVVKGVPALMDQNKLDQLIVVVPVTYYVRAKGQESSGLGLIISGDKLVFSASYAVLVYEKGESLRGEAQPVYRSIKQVYTTSCSCPPLEVTQDKRQAPMYTQAHVDVFEALRRRDFLAHLQAQIAGMMNGSSSIFLPPQKPLYYYLPY